MKFVAKAQESRERDANMMMRGFVKIQTAKVLCLRLQCLERIRADVLKFTTGTEGQMNKMSDDLISREAAVELVIAEYDRFQANGGSHSGRYELDKAIKMLRTMPTAFDKEKVIEELENYLFEKYCVEGDSRIDEIVEKGGIE